jgi:hypothetical protein
MMVLAQDTRIVPAAATARPAGSSPAPTIWPAGRTADEQALFAAQRAENEAFERRDVDAYAALTAPTFVRIFASGRVVPLAEHRVRVYGSIATMSYLNTAGEQHRISAVYRKEGGR